MTVFKTTLRITLFGILLLFSGAVIAAFFLPSYLQNSLIPRLFKKQGILLSLEVRRVGLNGADFSNFILAGGKDPWLQVDSIRLDYSFTDLLHKKIHRLVVEGLDLQAKIVDGKLVLPEFINNLKKDGAADSPPGRLPFGFDKVSITGAKVSVAGDYGPLSVPFEIDISARDGELVAVLADLSINGQPLNISATAEQRKWHMHSNYFDIDDAPFQLRGGGLDLLVADKDGTYSVNGTAGLEIGGSNGAFEIKPIQLDLTMQGALAPDGSWSFDLSAAEDDRAVDISGDQLTIKTAISQLVGHGAGRGAEFAADYRLALSPLTVETSAASGRIIKLLSVGQFDKYGVHTLTTFSGDGDGQGTHFESIKGTIPFNWPYDPKGEDGALIFGGVRYEKLNLGDVNLQLRQSLDGYAITGRYKSRILDGFCLDLEGGVDFLSALAPAGSVSFINKCTTEFRDLDLGGIIPEAAGYVLDTDLVVNGGISYGKQGPNGHLDLGLHHVNLNKGEDLSLEGGDITLSFAELSLRSGPEHLSFKKASFGDLYVEDGSFDFQIESAGSILLEKSLVRWCDGSIYTQAMRFSPKIKNYDLTLYCDHLNVAQVLEQLGAAAAEGRGRVNGRIPIRIIDGRLIPQDGFLYSTPGEGGVIRLTDTDKLTAGIPEGTPQFAQIDLAREALKNFSYDWTKLDLHAEGEDLVMHMQIDGKPESPLPFVYKKEFGGFVRVDVSNPGSRFQGIKLDVNFRLPLNQILYYGNSVKDLIN